MDLLVGLSCFSFHCADSLRNPKAYMYMWMVSRRDEFRGRKKGERKAWYRQEADAGVASDTPYEKVERRMKRRMEGSLRALGSHTYINVACQAYRATL